MKVAVFGATGGTGQHVVELAVARRMSVRALVRSSARLRPHPNVECVVGDVLDPGAVRDTVDGAAVVISALGIRGVPRSDRTLSTGTQNIVDAMQARGVARLICLTGFGLGDSRALAAPFFRFIVLPLLSSVYEDKARQEERVRASALDWTIVRPTHLTDAPPRGSVRHITDRSRWYDAISRGDLAAFLLDQADDARFVRQAIAVGAI